MVVRIAPSPISSALAIGDGMPHAADTLVARGQYRSPAGAAFTGREQQNGSPAETMPPPTPPGEAFAAAVISGQLAPRPITTDELRQRLGASWQPPSSPLHLMDKIA